MGREIKRQEMSSWIKLTVDSVTSYHRLGKGVSDGTATYGDTTETKNDITTEAAINTYTQGGESTTYAYPVVTDDPVSEYFLSQKALKKSDVAVEIVSIWHFMSLANDNTKYAAFKYDAVAPIADMGGTGQASLTFNITIANSGDVDNGLVDFTKFDAATNTIASDCFLEMPDDAILRYKDNATAPISVANLKNAGVQIDSEVKK